MFLCSLKSAFSLVLMNSRQSANHCRWRAGASEHLPRFSSHSLTILTIEHRNLCSVRCGPISTGGFDLFNISAAPVGLFELSIFTPKTIVSLVQITARTFAIRLSTFDALKMHGT